MDPSTDPFDVYNCELSAERRSLKIESSSSVSSTSSNADVPTVLKSSKKAFMSSAKKSVLAGLEGVLGLLGGRRGLPEARSGVLGLAAA